MKFFLRETVLTVGGVTMKYPDFEIRFTIPFDDDPKPNVGEIAVYNLSKATVNQLKKGYPVILTSGYQGNLGTILTGEVTAVKTIDDGLDSITTLTVSDSLEAWKTARVNNSYRPGTKASFILTDLIKLMGLKVGEMKPPRDPVYQRGRTVTGLAQQAMRDIAQKDCGAKLHIFNRSCYIRGPHEGKRTAFVLNSATGLIGSPTAGEKEINGKKVLIYEVVALLNHELYTDAIIKIESKVINGFYRIRAGSYISDDSQHVVKMEAVPA